jgi:hypothetical protein
MITFTPEEAKKMQEDLVEMSRKAKIASVKISVLRVGIGVFTSLVLSDWYPSMNAWYWVLLMTFASIAAWDVIASVIAYASVAVSTELEKDRGKK